MFPFTVAVWTSAERASAGMPVGPPTGFVVASGRLEARGSVEATGAGLTSAAASAAETAAAISASRLAVLPRSATPAVAPPTVRPTTRPKVANSDAFVSWTPITRWVRQPGHFRAPIASGRWQFGHEKTVCSISPIDIDSDAPIGGEGGVAFVVFRVLRRATSTVMARPRHDGGTRHAARRIRSPSLAIRGPDCRPSEGPAPAVRSPRPWQHVRRDLATELRLGLDKMIETEYRFHRWEIPHRSLLRSTRPGSA